MKKYIFTEEQIARLACVLNCITVTGMQQAEMLTICKQVLDRPYEIKEEQGADDNGK